MDKQLIRQHNVITEARYEMGAWEKNIVYMLLSQLKEQEASKKMYTVRIKDLQERVGSNINHVQVSQATTKLLRRMLYTSYGKEKELSFNLLTSGEYQKGQGTIELELSQEAKTFLFALKNNFTLFRLKVALNLKSKYAKRLYEMLSQYKDTGVFRVSMEELKARLFLREPQTGKEKYPKYGLFRAKVLDVAQKELNEKAEISFSYEAKKTGQKYTQLIFTIRKKKDTLQDNQMSLQQNAAAQEVILKRLVEKYQLSPWQAKRIIQEVPAPEIHKTLFVIQTDMVDNKLRNVGGYTATVFNKKYNLGLF